MDDRGVSAVFGYVLVLGIVTLLVGGLFTSAGGYVTNQHERVVRSEFEVVGNRVAADVAAVDRLALAAGPTGRASLLVQLPDQAAGVNYQVATSPVVGSTGVYHVNVTSTDPSVDVAVQVRVKTNTTLASGTVSGGAVRVVYNGTTLEVRDA